MMEAGGARCRRAVQDNPISHAPWDKERERSILAHVILRCAETSRGVARETFINHTAF